MDFVIGKKKILSNLHSFAHLGRLHLLPYPQSDALG